MDFLKDFAIEATDARILLNIAIAFVAGILISLSYMIAHKNKDFSKSFGITVLLLPAVVAVVIPLIATDLKKALSLAGIFALVRFRSVPGDSKDILYIFFSLTVGVAIALNYYAVGFVLLLLVSAVYVLLERFVNFTKDQLLRITIPEDMNYSGAFDDIFEKYLIRSELVNVKTSNMGTLFTIDYKVAVKDSSQIKQMIDELRTRNGNLNIVLMMNPESELKL